MKTNLDRPDAAISPAPLSARTTTNGNQRKEGLLVPRGINIFDTGAARVKQKVNKTTHVVHSQCVTGFRLWPTAVIT